MILDEIIEKRKIQLEKEISAVSEGEMKRLAETDSRQPIDFGGALKKSGLSIIAEVKKASPSKGLICRDFEPADIAREYEKNGASAISCLTEEFYFKGSSKYLNEIRKTVSLPILRKDFIICPYQIYEAKVIGADAVLLIAAVHPTEKLKEFSDIAHSLGLSVLAETHNEEELESVLEAGCDIVGVNNRNLKTFEVSLENTRRLMKLIPEDRVKVSESGIMTAEDMRFVRECGADAVLIGERLAANGAKGVAAAMAALLEGK
ncbi:MAG: indole-3-glycerol phosphate synthase TrpC [Ruminococcus sp.]|nr:indole-3-glycerol phosphate synthase TrpC [Ruminococcus sp.]